MIRLYIFIFLFFLIKNIQAQSDTAALKALTVNAFWNKVKANHPLAKQGSLYNRIASAELLAAKGGFDPKLYGDLEQKYFDSKNYFSLGEYGLKVPTWYGVELKGSYNTTRGAFLNPEEKLPKNGQAVVGISFPLLQGLMIDERRGNLFKAQQAQGLYEVERQNLLNDLAIETAKIYWKWAFYFQQAEIFRQALNVAQTRFKAIKISYEQGDRMAMDTLESFIQVQDRQFQYNDALLDFQNATTALTAFLSAGKNIALNSDNKPQNFNTYPLSLTADLRQNMLENLNQSHPAIRYYGFKMAQLNIDKRLKQEKFKPKLNLNYNFLGNGFQLSNIFNDNYKWGVSFSSSTLFRAERGDVELAKIKIENTQLMIEQKLLDLKNKLQQYFNETDNLQNQLNVYTDIVANYQRLLQLENARFELGESSLFLINSREMKFIESQVKIAKIRSEIEINRASIDYATGVLADKM